MVASRAARLVDGRTDGVPAWVEGAVVYGVIPRKFGGDGLRDVTARLDDLRDLGVDALWLSPINAAPEGDFGYAVTDYFDLNPDVGTKADLAELVREAHARGIRVLMDFVPNHTSAEHPYYLDALARGPASPYYDFYDRDAAGNATYYFDWTHLPNLNFDNPAVERMVLDAFAYWVRECDVDGYRVDVAWGVKNRRPDFWPRWRREMKALKPDLLLLAEASARDPYYVANGFDAAYDWTDELGHWAWEGVFDDALADPSSVVGRLRAALTNGGAGYPDGSLIFRFLNNNDTGPRFAMLYGPDLTRVAAALLLTLPGLPCVYTGDEIGAYYLPYGDRFPLDWDEDHLGLRPYYQALIGLRHRLPSLRSRAWHLLDAEPAASVLAYLRDGGPDDPPTLVVLHFARDAAEGTIPIPATAVDRLGTELIDALTGDRVAVSTRGEVRLPLPAWGVRILSPAPR